MLESGPGAFLCPNIYTVDLPGKDGDKLKEPFDPPVVVSSTHTAWLQDVRIRVLNILCEALEK